MKIQINLLTKDFGNFEGFITKEITEEEYSELVENSKDFYKSGFELELIDGSFIVVPPQVINNSILMIKIIE